jgi:hypothetical protein
MSSVPSSPLAFPSSDADPQDGQQMEVTPVRGSKAPRPLFGTPSPFPGRGQQQGSAVARRAVGMPYTPQNAMVTSGMCRSMVHGCGYASDVIAFSKMGLP